jgi:glycosyltransferase involved in cell wall biosynthesis
MTTGSPLVSVAMATYNGAPFLREQLDSILNQSRPPDEIVISDDNSQDATPAILAEYSSRYAARVRVLRNSQNLGFVRNFERFS